MQVLIIRRKGYPWLTVEKISVQTTFYNRLAEWELAYVDQTGKARTPVTHGDELVVTRRLFDKYLKLSREYYADFSGVGEIKEERTYENVGEE